MKKRIIPIVFLFSLSANAQVGIGKNAEVKDTETSVLLKFGDEGNKGIILPYVTTLPENATPGTILLDASDPSKARVKYYNGNEASPWVDISGIDGNVVAELSSQPTATEGVSSKVIIGAETSSADGVLVLESDTKAMVLPIVTDVQNVPSPSPGMLVYVKGDNGNKRFAVYNGTAWSFWKP